MGSDHAAMRALGMCLYVAAPGSRGGCETSVKLVLLGVLTRALSSSTLSTEVSTATNALAGTFFSSLMSLLWPLVARISLEVPGRAIVGEHEAVLLHGLQAPLVYGG